MSFRLKYEQETTPGRGIYLTTYYGHSFTFIELIKELYQLYKQRWGSIKDIRISYNYPNVRSWFWPKCGECGDRYNTEYCQECCEHEWDPGEGGMCINCGRDDYYNFIGG